MPSHTGATEPKRDETKPLISQAKARKTTQSRLVFNAGSAFSSLKASSGMAASITSAIVQGIAIVAGKPFIRPPNKHPMYVAITPYTPNHNAKGTITGTAGQNPMGMPGTTPMMKPPRVHNVAITAVHIARVATRTDLVAPQVDPDTIRPTLQQLLMVKIYLRMWLNNRVKNPVVGMRDDK